MVIEIEVQYYLLRRLLGIKADKSQGGGAEEKKQSKVQKLKVSETLMINIGSTSLGGKIVACD